MLWGYQVEEVTDAFTDRALVQGYNVLYNTMGNEPNRFLKSLMKRAREKPHGYKVVILGSYAPWDECKRRGKSRGEEHGRHVAEGFAKREYDKMFPKGACDRTHYDKFEVELLPGDERYLFDNTRHNEEPRLFAHDVAKLRIDKLDMGKLEKEKKKEDEKDKEKQTARESSRASIKKVLRDLDIYRNERNDLSNLVETLSEQEGNDADIVNKEREIAALEDKLEGYMRQVGTDFEPYVVAQKALVPVLERLEDRNPKMRRLAEIALSKIKMLQPNLLDEREYEELVKDMKDLPKRIFNNLADGVGYAPKLRDYARRMQLCRMPAICMALIQDLGDGTWLLTRMCHDKRDKKETAVEYFERLADLRKLLGTDERRVAELDRFYRKLGTQLAIPPKEWQSRYTLFPTLYAMKSDRIRIIDSLVGTPVLNLPLNILVGQACALFVLVIDFITLMLLIIYTFKVSLEIAHNRHDGVSLLTEVAIADTFHLAILYICSIYVLGREFFSIWAFRSLGESTRMKDHQPISMWTYLGNKWKVLNIANALSSMAFCFVSSQPAFAYWQIPLASFTTGMLWLRLLGYIRVLNINFATYITCLLQILHDITSFLVIMVIVMLLFGSMIFIWNIDANYVDLAWEPSWNIEGQLEISHDSHDSSNFDMNTFRTVFETLLTMFRCVLGESHRYWFHSAMDISIYVLYEIIVVILMLNVLIAVVGDSYEYSIIRARTTFVETRVELVVELETLGLTDPYTRINKWVREVQKKMAPVKKKRSETPNTLARKEKARRVGGQLLTRRLSRGAEMDDVDLEDDEISQLSKVGYGLLGMLQRTIFMEDDTVSLRDINTADSWLGRALDMERRTQKIVSMAELNIEDTLVGKVERMHRDIMELKAINGLKDALEA